MGHRRTRRPHPAIHRPALAPARNRTPVNHHANAPCTAARQIRPPARRRVTNRHPGPEASNASGMPPLRLNSYQIRYPDKDNNAAERQLRGPVVTRKNAGGSHNGDTARNAAVIWTVTATARMAALNLLTYLAAYLDECGRHGGKPLTEPAPQRFLPSKARPQDPRTW